MEAGTIRFYVYPEFCIIKNVFKRFLGSSFMQFFLHKIFMVQDAKLMLFNKIKR